MSGKRKVFVSTSANNGFSRKVLRTNIQFFFGTQEIATAMIDCSCMIERPEDLLTMKRADALRMHRDSITARGQGILEIDEREHLFQDEFIVDGDRVSVDRFIALVHAHVKTIFPELV